MEKRTDGYEASQAKQGDKNKPKTVKQGTEERYRNEKNGVKNKWPIRIPFFPTPSCPKK